MSPLSIEGVKVLCLSLAFLAKSRVVGGSSLKLRAGLDSLHLSALLGLGDFGLGGSLGLVDKFDDLGLDMTLSSVLLTFDLSDEHILGLLGLDDGYLLGCGRLHLQLVLFYAGTVDLRTQILHAAVVLVFEIGELLVLLVLKGQLLVAVFLYMVGKHVLALGALLQGLGELLVDMDVGDVTVFEDNTEKTEFLIKILDHLSGHVTLKIKDLGKPDTVDEVADTLIDFSVQ